MDTILSLHDLVCERGDFQLGPLNWQLPAGLFCSIVGPNGAGKTSLLQALMGILQVRSGHWEIDGVRIDPRQGEWKQTIAYAFDGQIHHEKLSVADNLALHASLRRQWDKTMAHELVSSFQLNPKQIVSTLSRGQRQALSLTLALAHRPRLLLLDEVTNGMDSLVRQSWHEIIFRMMAESDMSVLMATHVMADVTNLADKLVFIQAGRMVAEEEKDALMESWRQISCRFTGTMRELSGSRKWEKSGDSLRFISSQAAADLQTLKDLGVSHLESRPLSLDEICFYTLEAYGHV